MKNLLNKNLSYFFLSLLLSTALQAAKPSGKLIDKILGVINQQSYTLSEVRRVQKTLKGRKEISPVLYEKVKNTKEVLDHFFKIFIMHEELKAMGYEVDDERVNKQIQSTLDRVKMNKHQLISQLKKNGLTYGEYFQVIKESMQFSLFNQRIISPLIKISEEEIKSLYSQKASRKKSNTIKFTLIDYMINSSTLSDNKANKLQKDIKKMLDAGEKVSIKGLEEIDLGEVKSSGLNSTIRKHIKDTKQGDITKPLKLGGNYHFFHIVKKESSDTDDFEKVKPQIANYLFEQKSRSIIKTYFERKLREDYFVKYL